MKILHTADWHLGKKIEHFSRQQEQEQVLEEICQIADQQAIDVVLIAGDLFDTPNPPIEAIDLFYRTLKRLAKNGNRPVIGIAGNHDSPHRIEAPDPLAKTCGIILAGFPHSHITPYSLPNQFEITQSAPGFIEIQLPDQPPLRLILTPYANEARLQQALDPEKSFEAIQAMLRTHWQQLADSYMDPKGINLLMTHLFVLKNEKQAEAPEFDEGESERSVRMVGGAREIFTADIPPQVQYAALGHLHSYLEIQHNPFPVVYSSSPLCYAVDDRQKQKHVVIIDAQPDNPVSYQKIPLTQGKPAIQQIFSGLDEAITWLTTNPDVWIECIIKTDAHLTAQDRKRLYDAHDGILRIIPQFTDPELIKFTSGKQIDLSKSIDELFADYFFAKKQQTLNEELGKLFQEIIQLEIES